MLITSLTYICPVSAKRKRLACELFETLLLLRADVNIK